MVMLGGDCLSDPLHKARKLKDKKNIIKKGFPSSTMFKVSSNWERCHLPASLRTNLATALYPY